MSSRYSVSNARSMEATSRWRSCTPVMPISSTSIGQCCRNIRRPPNARSCTTMRWNSTGCELEAHSHAVQVVLVGALDLHGRYFTDTERPPACDIDRAIDLRRVGRRAPLGDGRPDLVDNHFLTRSDLALEAPCRNFLLRLHEAVPALLLYVSGNRRAHVVGGRALYMLVFETAHTIECRFLEPLQQDVEVRIGLARKADD